MAHAMKVAEGLVRDGGCDPIIVGNLAAATSLQPGGPGFRAHLTPELRRRLGVAGNG